MAQDKMIRTQIKQIVFIIHASSFHLMNDLFIILT